MFKKAIDLFIKSKFCMIAYVLFFCGITGYCAFKEVPVALSSKWEHLIDNERPFLTFSIVLFILFLFISYEYFAKAKRANFDECLSVTKNSEFFRLNQFFVMELLALFFGIVITALSLIDPLKRGSADFTYISYILRLSLLYFFVADTIAVLLGMVLSNLKNNIIAYVLLILCTFMFSPIPLGIADTVYAAAGIYTHPFFYIFELLPRDYPSQNYDSYGFPLNSINVMRAVFWLFLFSGILCFKYLKRNHTARKAVVSISLIAVILSGIYINLPYSNYPYHKDDPVKGYEGFEYYKSQDYKKMPMQYEEPAGFEITAMDIDLKVGRQLSAKTSVQVDDTSLSGYKFTLFRNYKIKSITDENGNKLKFDRYSDYVTVYPAEGENITEKIIFEYSGYSAGYYSNNQGIFLPVGFYYYPINGFHYVYDLHAQRYIKNVLDKPVPIHLTVDTRKTVYSNLERVSEGKNEFSGTADGVTILSGFYRETEIEGCRVVYIAYGTYEEQVFKNIKDTIKKAPSMYKDKVLINTPSTRGGSYNDFYFVTSDHILFYNDSYFMEKDNGYLYNDASDNDVKLLYKMLTYYDMDSELYKFCEAYKNGELSDTDKNSLDYILAQKIEEYGIDNACNWVDIHISQYMEGSMEDIAAQIGEKTEVDLQFEEYEREHGLT